MSVDKNVMQDVRWINAYITFHVVQMSHSIFGRDTLI